MTQRKPRCSPRDQRTTCSYKLTTTGCAQTCCTYTSPDQRSCAVDTLSYDSCLRSFGNGTHGRRLFSTTRVSHWATFFNGGRGDQLVNIGKWMPAGCRVEAVPGVHDHSNVAQFPATAVLNHGSHGFTVSRRSTHPQALDANIHWWHDGASSIAARAVYYVTEPDGVNCSVAGATQDSP